MKKKKLIIKTAMILILVALITIICLAVSKTRNQNEAEKDNSNTSGNVTDIQNEEAEIVKLDGVEKIENIENIEISNIELSLIRNNKTKVSAKAINTSNEYSNSKILKIEAIDENGDVIATFSGMLSSMAGKEEVVFETQVLKDIMEAVRLKFSLSI